MHAARPSGGPVLGWYAWLDRYNGGADAAGVNVAVGPRRRGATCTCSGWRMHSHAHRRCVMRRRRHVTTAVRITAACRAVASGGGCRATGTGTGCRGTGVEANAAVVLADTARRTRWWSGQSVRRGCCAVLAGAIAAVTALALTVTTAVALHPAPRRR